MTTATAPNQLDSRSKPNRQPSGDGPQHWETNMSTKQTTEIDNVLAGLTDLSRSGVTVKQIDKRMAKHPCFAEVSLRERQQGFSLPSSSDYLPSMKAATAGK